MQVYKDVPIISNKHPLEEREGVPHHVMDYVNWDEEYFIHRFKEDANKAIEDIHSRGKTPIVIGGTHYYLQNLLFKNKTIGETEERVHSKTEKPLTKEQLEILDGPVEGIFKTLSDIDPVISQKFHPQDKRKLRRALEIYYTLGSKASDLYHDQKLDELEDTSLKYNTLLFWVYADPEVLKPRLDKRVDKMMESGALEEIQQMYEFYEKLPQPKPDFTSGIWQVIGFKEFLPWLQDGSKSSQLFADGVERMKIRTRQYAKYQVKWIKKLLSVELQKESRFNYKYGGKLYLLDATDLTEWQNNVNKIGLGIANQFLKQGPTKVTYAQSPAKLVDVFPNEEYLSDFKSNKKLEAAKNWQHFECTICKDKQGNNLVAVGEENWRIHIESRRHKKQLQFGERKRKHEQFQLQYKKQKDNTAADKKLLDMNQELKPSMSPRGET